MSKCRKDFKQWWVESGIIAGEGSMDAAEEAWNARVPEGKHVQRWWGKHKLPDVELLREYSLNYISNLHPLDIQQGVFLTAGMEAGNISELKIFQSEKSFEELFK